MKRRSMSFLSALLASIASLALHAQSPAPDQAALKEIDLSLLGSEADRQEILEGALKKGNIDFGQSTIHYWTVNPGYASTQSYPPEKEDLAVVDYAPTGELPIEMRRPTIYVMFNLPMVPIAQLGEPMA